MTVLTELIAALDRGTLKVVDLTQPLGPDTPVIGLPPMFARVARRLDGGHLALRRQGAGAGTGTP